MKSMSTRILVLGLNLAFLGACTTTQDTTTAESPKSEIKEGWQDVKEGTSEMAEGVGTAASNAGTAIAEGASEVGQDIKEGTQEAGLAVKESACPVVANKQTRKYYTQTSKEYSSMLKGEKVLSADMRECFMSEKAAMSDGYQKAM